jgi:hypothetical protein
MAKAPLRLTQGSNQHVQRAVETGTLLGFGEVKASPDITEGGLV